MSFKDPFPFKAFFECSDCNGIISEKEMSKQSMTVVENATNYGLADAIINNPPKCEHCGKKLMRTFR